MHWKAKVYVSTTWLNSMHFMLRESLLAGSQVFTGKASGKLAQLLKSDRNQAKTLHWTLNPKVIMRMLADTSNYSGNSCTWSCEHLLCQCGVKDSSEQSLHQRCQGNKKKGDDSLIKEQDRSQDVFGLNWKELHKANKMLTSTHAMNLIMLYWMKYSSIGWNSSMHQLLYLTTLR